MGYIEYCCGQWGLGIKKVENHCFENINIDKELHWGNWYHELCFFICCDMIVRLMSLTSKSALWIAGKIYHSELGLVQFVRSEVSLSDMVSENSSLILALILRAKLDFNSCASRIKRSDSVSSLSCVQQMWCLQRKHLQQEGKMHNSSFLVQRGSVLRHKTAPVIPILTRSKSSVLKLLSTSHFHTNNVEREETSVLFWRFSYRASEER